MCVFYFCKVGLLVAFTVPTCQRVFVELLESDFLSCLLSGCTASCIFNPYMPQLCLDVYLSVPYKLMLIHLCACLLKASAFPLLFSFFADFVSIYPSVCLTRWLGWPLSLFISVWSASGWFRWERDPPSSCPFPTSSLISAIEFNLGVNHAYGNADTCVLRACSFFPLSFPCFSSYWHANDVYPRAMSPRFSFRITK